jgi:hypothetical protein
MISTDIHRIVQEWFQPPDSPSSFPCMHTIWSDGASLRVRANMGLPREVLEVTIHDAWKLQIGWKKDLTYPGRDE